MKLKQVVNRYFNNLFELRINLITFFLFSKTCKLILRNTLWFFIIMYYLNYTIIIRIEVQSFLIFSFM